MAEYHNMLYLHDERGLNVNLYIPSEVTWKLGDQNIRLRQETDYPERDTSTMSLTLERPANFVLRLRVPGWSKGIRAAVNGTAVDASADSRGWVTIDREWRSGDVVVTTIAMALRKVPVDRQHRDRVAIMYGPVVLAQDEACCRRPFAIAPETELATRLIREGDGLRFRITNTVPERHTRYLQPLYSVPGFWPYWVYFDLNARPLY
jgi:DUF1680 family protein